MRTEKDIAVDKTTKEAWEENWADTGMERILEIFRYPRVKKQMEICTKYLPRDKKILEGGCGLGPYLVQLRRMGYDVIGIDYNQGPLDKITRYDKTIPLYRADVLDIPFTDSYFGAYLSLGVIEHFTQGPGPAIKEAYRVLTPGGYFLVSVPRFSIFDMIKSPLTMIKRSRLLRTALKKKAQRHYWQQYFGIAELSDVFKKNGFEIIRIVPIDHDYALAKLCNYFRDSHTYDATSNLALSIGNICQGHMPWVTADSMIFICKKPD